VRAAPGMATLLDIDRSLVDASRAFEHPLLTAVFVLLSAWWVKGPLLVGLGLCSDLRCRRLPLAFAAAAVAVGFASLAADLLKRAFDRARPPELDPSLGALTPLPDNASFPSGHSATAFAAATAVAIISPRLRPWALGIAAAVALSRLYLRVHFPLDVAAGALLGAGLGAACALVALRFLRPAAAA
jgi:undecaprenyl-diphosphatase